VLARSRVTGRPVRLCVNRGLLARVLDLNFRDLRVLNPDTPFLCEDADRQLVCMPLDNKAAVGPSGDCLRLNSAEGASVRTPP
jgi:hypothetical protein